MRVSLSASHNNNEKAIAVLAQCELIYTTQFQRIQELQQQFPEAQILPLPDSRNDTINYLRERHREDEVIDFSDLMQLRNGG